MINLPIGPVNVKQDPKTPPPLKRLRSENDCPNAPLRKCKFKKKQINRKASVARRLTFD